jgi:hypothetical protein
MLPPRVKVVGLDPSLNNWGVAMGWYDTIEHELTVDHVQVIQPVLPTGKQVRQNSKDLEAAAQLFGGALLVTTGAHAVFVEVPHGSQSARAMASYGICVGVLAGLRGMGRSFFEVTSTEVKLAGYGKKTATKQQMIAWAMAKHPEANWPMYTREGKQVVSEAKAEHMADAVAAIYAGIASQPFQQLLSLNRLKAA